MASLAVTMTKRCLCGIRNPTCLRAMKGSLKEFSLPQTKPFQQRVFSAPIIYNNSFSSSAHEVSSTVSSTVSGTDSGTDSGTVSSTVSSTDSGSDDIIEEDERFISLMQIKVRAHDNAVLESYIKYIQWAANHLNINISDKIILPMYIEKKTLLASPHIYSKHRRQYETRTHCRMVNVTNVTGDASDIFLEYIQRNLPEGVAMSVEQTELESFPEFIGESLRALQAIEEEEEVLEDKKEEDCMEGNVKMVLEIDGDVNTEDIGLETIPDDTSSGTIPDDTSSDTIPDDTSSDTITEAIQEDILSSINAEGVASKAIQDDMENVISIENLASETTILEPITDNIKAENLASETIQEDLESINEVDDPVKEK